MRILVVTAVAALVVVVAGVALLGGESDRSDVAEFDVVPPDGSRARGVAFLERRGERTRGLVVVWGLPPNSDHAVHFHGPNSSCGTKADPVAVHPDLRADGDGVAYARVDVVTEEPLLDGGFYYNVHEGPSRRTDSPEIACGDVEPRRAEASGD